MWKWMNKLTSKKVKNSVSLDSDDFLKMLGIDIGSVNKDKLSEITYFTCLRLLSESVGKLPLKLYKDTNKGLEKAAEHHLYNVLKLRPNPYMTSSTFWSTVEVNKNHYGNAYVYINTESGQVKDLWILPSEHVQVWIDNAGIFQKENAMWYIWGDNKSGKQYRFRHDQIMHFKTSMSLDGIKGLAVKDILKVSIENIQSGSQYLSNYFQNGLMGKAVVSYTGDLSHDIGKKMAERVEEFSSGLKNAGRIVPLPLGFQLTPLNVKMADAQFLEISKYTALQIAGAFGIKPAQINNYDKGNYANVEAQQLSFYVDTLLYNLKQYEEELSYKLLLEDDLQSGHCFKFNVNAILRADFATQMEALSKGVNNAILKPNEAREKIDLPYVEGGDSLMCNGNYVPLATVGKGGENGGLAKD
ncbi:phage portal protein [Bacillus mycoides]|uniref:phage portal protein n=1 Tax=Bacillus mycoides TaxID=1405 RepID=UPI002E1D6ABD|nr:phage portal protein [Bacillus mycoides]MED1406815.1 phage portal protein [Bacillus mycoides]